LQRQRERERIVKARNDKTSESSSKHCIYTTYCLNTPYTITYIHTNGVCVYSIRTQVTERSLILPSSPPREIHAEQSTPKRVRFVDDRERVRVWFEGSVFELRERERESKCCVYL